MTNAPWSTPESHEALVNSILLRPACTRAEVEEMLAYGEEEHPEDWEYPGDGLDAVCTYASLSPGARRARELMDDMAFEAMANAAPLTADEKARIRQALANE